MLPPFPPGLVLPFHFTWDYVNKTCPCYLGFSYLQDWDTLAPKTRYLTCETNCVIQWRRETLLSTGCRVTVLPRGTSLLWTALFKMATFSYRELGITWRGKLFDTGLSTAGRNMVLVSSFRFWDTSTSACASTVANYILYTTTSSHWQNIKSKKSRSSD